MSSCRHPVRRIRAARSAAAAPIVALVLAACVVSGLARAQDAPHKAVALPLTAPAGADPFLAEFVELCTVGVLDVAKGRDAGIARGWKTGAPDDGAARLATLDAYSGEKVTGSGIAVVSMTTALFPHLAMRTCELHAAVTTGTTIDLGSIERIEGVRGGIGTLSGVPQAGFWSLVDRENAVVTITAIPVSDEVTFIMSRGVRLDPETHESQPNSQKAR